MALAEAPASFSGFRSFRIVLPLQRWPHFRASARSESCSRCSAGVISSAMPRHAMQCYVVFRCAMPCLQLQCYDMQCVTTQCYVMLCHATVRHSTPRYAMICSVPLCDAMLCVAMLCDAMLHYAMPRRAMTCYALPCSSTPCYAVLYHASRTLSGSLPCSTSDCTNKEEIYAMVRDGREG